MGKPGRSDSSGLSHIERFLLRGNRLRVHVFGAVDVRLDVDLEIVPGQRGAHGLLDLVDGFHVIVAVELAGLHFDAQEDVVLRHVHGLHVQQSFDARRGGNRLDDLPARR